MIIIPISEKKKASNKKWNDTNMKDRYERIQLVVPKGRKETIQAHAKLHDKSLNAFINRAIKETIERDTGVSSNVDIRLSNQETI